MKIKTLILALLVSIIAVAAFAQNEKISVKYQNAQASQVISDLFRNYNKDYSLKGNLQDGYITLSMTDKPFDVVLTAILNQINATFEYKDGVYTIMPDASAYGTGMGTAGRTGIGPTGMTTGPGGTTGIAGPTLGGQTGAGVTTGMGVNPGMGQAGRTTGMGGQGQGTLKPRSFEDPIMKIRINYNSPYQILSLMDGDDYTDVVWNNSGSNGSSNNSNNNNNNSNNNNSNSSSRSSRSSNR